MNDERKLKGVLLDIDGTLVLSNDAHAHAWVEAFTQHGISMRFEDVRPLIGMGADKIIPALSPRLDHESGLGKQIADSRQQVFLSKFVAQVKPAPGARALCQRMRAQGLLLPIASSAQSEELEVLLSIAVVKGLVEVPDSDQGGKQSKPSADVVTAALQRTRLQPTEAIMLGDTPFDIIAAAKCDISTIAVRCGGWPDGRLKDAIEIYDDPADLLAHYDSSVLAGSTGIATVHERR